MCQRCHWATNQTLLEQDYHDNEWGMPQTDDNVLFEFLVLEAAQAGLSWRTVLEKREGYRHHYLNFDPVAVAAFDDAQQQVMLADPGIIRNKLKVASSISNAREFLRLQKEHGSFARYLWRFVDNKPIQNSWKDYTEVPAETDISKQLSKALKKEGMRFVGPTIMYAYMQAVGMVNDHEVSCCRYQACSDAGAAFSLS
ncbi:DNA-3-methyladenine glycosylase I [Neptunomonas japonica]|uniref:DNA-3-methyladenine glycosylase I n=1 Tax=Neptunomonas japonica TaxID=417574 RepID=UPI000425510B|nr:DNA-3-methyladenine glycosylase I [Neptunomonas japonica]